MPTNIRNAYTGVYYSDKFVGTLDEREFFRVMSNIESVTVTNSHGRRKDFRYVKGGEQREKLFFDNEDQYQKYCMRRQDQMKQGYVDAIQDIIEAEETTEDVAQY